MSVDLADDRSLRNLHRFSQLYSFPAFVKTADVDSLLDDGSGEPDEYADPINRRYRCHNPSATWLQAVYFENAREGMSKSAAAAIKEQLDRLASFWGVLGQVEDMRQEHQELRRKVAEAQEVPDEHYALVIDDETVPTRKYPLRNPAEIQKAAEYLVHYRGMFPYRVREKMASRILKRAAEEQVDLGKHEAPLKSTAGMGEPNYAKIGVMLGGRAVISRGDSKQMCEHLSKMLEPEVYLPREKLGEIVERIDDMDRNELKLFGRYGSGLEYPEDVFFFTHHTEKMASDDCQLTTGSAYRVEDFSKLALDDLRDVMGDDFVAAVRRGFDADPVKVAEVASTLPRGDAEIFERFLTQIGISPT